jgi:hypothetical protein
VSAPQIVRSGTEADHLDQVLAAGRSCLYNDNLQETVYTEGEVGKAVNGAGMEWVWYDMRDELQMAGLGRIGLDIWIFTCSSTSIKLVQKEY